MSTPEEYATRIQNDFKVKDAALFLGKMGIQGMWPCVHAVPDRAIPLNYNDWPVVAEGEIGHGLSKVCVAVKVC